MESFTENYYKNLSPDDLINFISKRLYALRGSFKAKDFDFNHSKNDIIESIEIIEKHLSILQKKIKELKKGK